MGEPSDIKADDTAAAEGKAAASSEAGSRAAGSGWWARSWIGRHWRGELPLNLAFWANGFFLNVALGLVAWWLDYLMDDDYESARGDTLFLLPFISLFQKWQMAWGCWGHPAGCLYNQLNPEGLHRDVARAMFAFTSAVTVWQIVGIWRSARRYAGLPNHRSLWPSMVAILMVWWICVWGLQLPDVFE